MYKLEISNQWNLIYTKSLYRPAEIINLKMHHLYPNSNNYSLSKISIPRHTKSQNWNDSHLILHLPLHNPLKPGVKSRMKIKLEQRRQAMFQLHLSDPQFYCQLDESTARRQLKSPQSLPVRSIHLTLVTKWSWSWMTYCHLLCAMSISPRILRYNYFKIWPWKSMVKVICVVKGRGHIWPSKFKGQGYGQVQTHWSHLRPGVQSIRLLFVSRQSDHFWLRYSKFYIWPWKFKVKVMAKVKPDGHIWALEFNRYVCFSFRGNQTIFGWDIANSVFDLENSRSRSWSNPMVTFEP